MDEFILTKKERNFMIICHLIIQFIILYTLILNVFVVIYFFNNKVFSFMPFIFNLIFVGVCLFGMSISQKVLDILKKNG